MRKFTAIVPLPFYLPFCPSEELQIPYNALPVDRTEPMLKGRTFNVTAHHRRARPDRSDLPQAQTELHVELKAGDFPPELEKKLKEGILSQILVVVNHFMDAYRCATGQVSNVGLITRLGLEHLQLFAELRLDGCDIRDGWPFRSSSNRIPPDKRKEFHKYLLHPNEMKPEQILYCDARVALARGDYYQSFILAVVVIEVALTELIAPKLSANEESKFRKATLGQKLDQLKCKHRLRLFHEETKLQSFWSSLDRINAKRKRLLHYGCRDVTTQDANGAIKAAGFGLHKLESFLQ